MRPRAGLMVCLLAGSVVALFAWLTPVRLTQTGRPGAGHLPLATGEEGPSPTIPRTPSGLVVNDPVDPTRKPALPPRSAVTQFVVEVLQSDQTPLADANVVVTRNQELLRQGVTDNSGQVSFALLEGAVEIIVFTGTAIRARRTCADTSELNRIVLAGHGLVGTALVDGQVPGQSIWLRLESDRDSHGLEKPPAWLWSELGFKGLEGQPWLWIRTDARGAFRCDGLLPGWSGTIEPGEGYRLANGSAAVLVVDSTTHVLVSLVALPQIRGRIVQPESGQPVPLAEGTCEILCQAGSLLTGVRCGPDGRFKILLSGCSSFERACLEFSVPALGYVMRRVEGVATSSGIDLGDIVLEPVRELHFDVRSPDGIPIGGAVARVSGSGTMRSDPTDQNGRGILRGAPLTMRELLVDAFNHEPAVIPIARGIGASVTPVEVLLNPLRGLLILVEREDDPAHPDLRVVLECWDSAPFLSVSGSHPDPIQIELGASSPARVRWHPKPIGGAPAVELSYRLDGSGTVRISGLRTLSRTVVSIRTKSGEVLESKELAPIARPGVQNLRFTLWR